MKSSREIAHPSWKKSVQLYLHLLVKRGLVDGSYFNNFNNEISLNYKILKIKKKYILED
jgi:hypothetical protein